MIAFQELREEMNDVIYLQVTIKISERESNTRLDCITILPPGYNQVRISAVNASAR